MNYYTAPLQFFERHFFLCETTYSVVFYTFLEIIMRQFPYEFTFSTVAHNPFCSSQPSMVHWLSSPIFPYWSSVRPAMVTSNQISTFNMYRHKSLVLTQFD